jgi:hypothetical protein
VVGAAGALAGLGGFVEREHGAPREWRDWELARHCQVAAAI